MTNAASIEENIFMARVCEQAERFQDMIDFLRPVVAEKGPEMSIDERNLISVAFKNLVSSKRIAWRTIQAVIGNSKYERYASSIQEYKEKIEQGLETDCYTIVELVKTLILSKPCADEPKAFFLKLVADYYRYAAEISTGERLELTKQEAKKAYEEAYSLEMQACSPIRLGLALNFSVFYFEICKDAKSACALADSALQMALERIDDLGEEEFRDAKSIIELLRENLSLW